MPLPAIVKSGRALLCRVSSAIEESEFYFFAFTSRWVTLLFSDDAGNSVIEYCNGEAFEPRCHGNDAIVMLSARYGRMKIGRCITRNPGFEPMLQDPRYLGCSADVLNVVSRFCSGRKECSLRVRDQNFDSIKPCYDTLKMHLEAAFMCINGKRHVPWTPVV